MRRFIELIFVAGAYYIAYLSGSLLKQLGENNI